MDINLEHLKKLMGAENLERIYDLFLNIYLSDKANKHLNPLNKLSKFFGFSQNEEDAITLEILNRIGIKRGTFWEFGVGNGLENNTIILLALGWKGAWFGGQNLAFNISDSRKLTFTKEWITNENILNLISPTTNIPEVISLDLDGNDIYLVEKLLSNNICPKLFIVEYNGKFPPPIEFKMKYNPSHVWDGSDYFGASLHSFNALFEKYNFTLVCCNLSGANAFFVSNEFSKNFTDIPKDLEILYNEPSYFLRNRKMHPTSPKTIETFIN